MIPVLGLVAIHRVVPAQSVFGGLAVGLNEGWRRFWAAFLGRYSDRLVPASEDNPQIYHVQRPAYEGIAHSFTRDLLGRRAPYWMPLR